MACAKKRKADSENRAVDQEWTDSYMFILPRDIQSQYVLFVLRVWRLLKHTHKNLRALKIKVKPVGKLLFY